MRAYEFIFEAGEPSTDRLVRVVPNIDNLSVGKDGSININHNLDLKSLRNTSHWTQNSVVGSHEMGDWSKAGYAIVADPKEIKNPLLGARPEDTWYALDKNKQLNVGRPTILAPKDAPVPKGINVVRYEGDRNAALQQHFASQNLPFRGETGRNNLAGVDMNQYHQIGQEFARKYGSPKTTLDSHMNTVHSRAEGTVGSIQDQLNAAKQSGQKYVTTDSKSQIPVWQHAQNQIRSMKDDIRNYVKNNPEAAKFEKEYWRNVVGSLKQSAADAEAMRLADKNRTGSFKNLPGPKPIPGPPPLPAPPPPPSSPPKSPMSLKTTGMKGGGGGGRTNLPPDIAAMYQLDSFGGGQLGADIDYPINLMKAEKAARALKK